MHVATLRVFSKNARIEYIGSKPVKQTDELGVGVEESMKTLNHFKNKQKKASKKENKEIQKSGKQHKIAILQPGYQNKIHLVPEYVSNKREPLKTHGQTIGASKRIKNDIPDKS